MTRQHFPATLRAVGPREFKFIGSTDQLARDGHILLPSGLQLANYRANPIVLWQHNAAQPVARCTQIGIIEGELRGTAEFPPLGTTALADEVCGLVKSGVVSGLSIGFDIIDAEPLDPRKPRGGLRITRSELLECSLVSRSHSDGSTHACEYWCRWV